MLAEMVVVKSNAGCQSGLHHPLFIFPKTRTLEVVPGCDLTCLLWLVSLKVGEARDGDGVTGLESVNDQLMT